MIETCEKEKTDLLLIAGDLFHRQPLLRELKEVRYMFEKLTRTQVVMIAGNHDYVKADSYYRTFSWPEHVHMLLEEEPTCINLPKIHTSVCGFSYHAKEIREKLDLSRLKQGRERYQILLLHGGDETHVPFRKEDLRKAQYDYVALGHIHKPQILVEGKAAYCGALEPIDKNDTGMHGYIKGEITEDRCKITFVPASVRRYVHEEIVVTQKDTDQSVRERILESMKTQGQQYFYKFILTGFRDPDMVFESAKREEGTLLEVVDQTKPAYDFEQLKKQHREDILGAFIEELGGYPQNSIQYQAMCEGVHALMDTRRG